MIVIQSFVPKLKDRLLSRLMNPEYDADERVFSSEERATLQFVNNLNNVLRPKRFEANYHNIRHAPRPGHTASWTWFHP